MRLIRHKGLYLFQSVSADVADDPSELTVNHVSVRFPEIPVRLLNWRALLVTFLSCFSFNWRNRFFAATYDSHTKFRKNEDST